MFNRYNEIHKYLTCHAGLLHVPIKNKINTKPSYIGIMWNYIVKTTDCTYEFATFKCQPKRFLSLNHMLGDMLFYSLNVLSFYGHLAPWET